MSKSSSLQIDVQVEKPSSILRKMTVVVPAQLVKQRMDEGLVEVQKKSNLKGFRPGFAPISVIRQYFGDDVKHRVFHRLIDESFEEAVQKNEIRAIGSPKIDTPDHKTGQGDHDHTLHEDKDLKYIATFEVIPEVSIKGYTGLSVSQEKVEITDDQVVQVVNNLLNSQAQLIPATSALAQADGNQVSRPIQKGDFVDTKVQGGLVTESGVEARPDMSGTRMIEVGSNAWVPGFEEHLLGMRSNESKTFRLAFPKDFALPELAEKEAEFSVTIQEIKEKKLPELNDEFAKQMGHESVEDLRTKAKEYLVKERTEESDRQVKSELLAQILAKNTFEVPNALVEAQARALAQEWAQELKRQRYPEDLIQETISKELDALRQRADNQVRSSLALEAIAKEEGITVQADEISAEIKRLAGEMNVEEAQLLNYYAKNPGKKGDLEFRLRQERTLKFVLDKSKIKVVPAKEK